MFHHCITDTKCIISLCELCVYKEGQSDKLLAVLQAIQTLATAVKKEEEEEGEQLRDSGYTRKEIIASGQSWIGHRLCNFAVAEIIATNNNSQLPKLCPNASIMLFC